MPCLQLLVIGTSLTFNMRCLTTTGLLTAASAFLHACFLQSLVIGTSMLVVAFITLLQNPLLGSPSWLPLLAGGWACAFIVTMVLQSTLPLPNIQK